MPVIQSLSPSTHGLAKWTLEQSGYDKKNEVRCRLSNEDFHSLRLMRLQPLLGAQTANSRDQHSPQPDMDPREAAALRRWAAHTSIRAEVEAFLSEQTGERFAVPAHNDFAKLTIHGIIKIPFFINRQAT